jgi:hypothetical protein
MGRLFLTLLVAHVVASYGLVVGLAIEWGTPRADVWLLAPAEAPRLIGRVTVGVWRGNMPPRTAAMAYAGYALGFAATAAVGMLHRREGRKSRRRRLGLCTECGYDLTGNVSGKCPECGAHVNAKARLMVCRGG